MKLLEPIVQQTHHDFLSWRMISHNWLVALVNKFVIVTTVLSIGVLLWRFRLLPPEVPLWYQKPWGQDQLASGYWLIVLPLGSIVIYLVNGLISIYFTLEHLVFTQILFLTSLVVSLLSFITLIKILFLVS